MAVSGEMVRERRLNPWGRKCGGRKKEGDKKKEKRSGRGWIRSLKKMREREQ